MPSEARINTLPKGGINMDRRDGKLTRRYFIQASLGTLGAAALAACAKPTPEVVKETVVVEKEVEKEVTKVV